MHKYDMNAVDFTLYTVICGHNCVLLKRHADLNDTSDRGLLSSAMLYFQVFAFMAPHITV